MDSALGRRWGLPLTVVSMIGISVDGLLVKLAIQDGLSPATAVIGKYVFATTALICFLALLYVLDKHGVSGKSPFICMPSALGWKHIAAAAFLTTLVELCYTLGFHYTTSANVLAFSSLAPLWSALLSKLWLKVHVPRRTIIASLLALAGSVVVAVGVGFEALTGDVGIQILGLLLAIGTGVFVGFVVTIVQSAAMHAPETQMLFANLIGFIVAGIAGFALLPALHPPDESIIPANVIALLWIGINGTLGTALAMSGLTVAGRLIPATEISLLLQIESILGPLSTFLVLDEVPSLFTLVGGGFVVVTVAMHEALAFWEEQQSLQVGSSESTHHADTPISVAAPAAQA
mmetsp:Transcript_19165/g.51614  ORF Transcript_19165/g.51614 Transcript_19165/m.51614 type:complete len:347 (-) Transcript_19165:239-1279(-)